MTDEEKKAIEILKLYFGDNPILYITKYINIVLNLIEKQSKEIEHQKEKRENQKQELAILNAKQIEFNKLVNTVNSYKGQFKRQQKEIEEIKKLRQILNNVEFGKFSYDKNYQVKIEAGRQQGKSFRAGMEFSNKIWKDKIKAKIEESELLIDNSQGCMSNEDLYKEFGKIEFGKSLLEKE